MSRGPQHIRLALIAALLVYCFENFHGGHKTAINHIQSGIFLMNEWQATRSRRSLLPAPSPLPDAIEDDLINAFYRLDMTMVWVDPTFSLKFASMNRSDLLVPIHIPAVFTSIEEARTCFVNINRGIAQIRNIPTVDQVLQDPNHHPDSVHVSSDPPWPPGALQVCPLTSVNYFEDSVKARDKIYSEMDRWHLAFAPLLKQAEESETEFIPASTLQIMVQSTHICMRGIFEEPPEFFEPTVRYVLSQCAAMIAHPRFRSTFVFDSGIIPPLFLIAMQGSSIELRKEAVRLLRKMVPRKEGVWDAATSVSIVEKCMQQELGETGEEEEIVAEGAVNEP